MEYVEIESQPEHRHIVRLMGKSKNRSQGETLCGLPFALDESIVFSQSTSANGDKPPAEPCDACFGVGDDVPDGSDTDASANKGDELDPTEAAAAFAPQPVAELPIRDISPDPQQPRKYFDQAKLEELAASIKEHGVLSAIEVRPDDVRRGKFLITFGERRWRAAELAGLATIPAMVVAETSKGDRIEDGHALERQLIENGQREDISPLEQGEAYTRLRKAYGMPIEDLMQRTGKSRTHIYARMKLTELVPPAKKALAEGKLQPAIAELATTIGDPKLQEQFVKECLGQKLEWKQINDLEMLGVQHEAVTEHEDGSGDASSQPLSFRAARALQRRRYSTRLALAKFDTTDPDLVPVAGACSGCPFRSGNQPELPGVANGKASDDMCTNTPCFEQKTKAAWKRTAADAKTRGLDVLTYDDAKKDRIFDFGGTAVAARAPYVDPDAELPQDLMSKPGKAPTWSKLLGKKLDDIPRAIVQDASGAPRELIDYNAAVAALQEAGKIDKPKKAEPTKSSASSSTKPKKDKASEKRTEDKRALRGAFLKRLEREVITMSAGIPEKKEMAWWRWLVTAVGSAMLTSDSQLLEVIDTKKPWAPQLAAKVKNVGQAKSAITGIVFGALTENAVFDENGRDDGEILAVAELLGINPKKIAEEVAQAAKAEEQKTAEKKAKKGKAK